MRHLLEEAHINLLANLIVEKKTAAGLGRILRTVDRKHKKDFEGDFGDATAHLDGHDSDTPEYAKTGSLRKEPQRSHEEMAEHHKKEARRLARKEEHDGAEYGSQLHKLASKLHTLAAKKGGQASTAAHGVSSYIKHHEENPPAEDSNW